jgi:tRNA(His) guanylyltransferase
MKLNYILAGEASAKFSILLGAHAVFDCRISELPSVELVCDYFRWRNEDAHRNALNAHCYWALRNDGKSAEVATRQLKNLSVGQKNELLFGFGVNFNDLPNWQKRGTGLYWEEYEKPALDPRSGQEVFSKRRRIKVDYNLPMKETYNMFVATLISAVACKEGEDPTLE